MNPSEPSLRMIILAQMWEGESEHIETYDFNALWDVVDGLFSTLLRSYYWALGPAIESLRERNTGVELIIQNVHVRVS